jgi:hypothetical protein
MKLIFKVLFFLFLFTTYQSFAQDNKGRREHHRVWRKWRKNKQSYNPYLDKKAKHKPSAKIANGNKKDLKRKNRAIRKQKRALRKKSPKH